jgi:hypothetical protein
MVIAEFNLDTSSAIAAQDVRDKIAPVTAQHTNLIAPNSCCLIQIRLT